MATTRVQDFYKATITRNWTATTGDFNVSVAPTISAGIIVISPNSTTQREIVRYTATGTNQYGPFVTVSNVAHRGLSGTTAQSHIIGEQVRMNVTAVHWDELLADAVAPTVDVGTTTTLDPGSDATVTNSGTTINAIVDLGIPAGSTIYSGTSIPDNSVGRNGDWAFDTSVNSYVWYKSGGAWALVNSLKGATGDGNGIASIVKTNTVGLVDTYTITYDDATTSTFDVTNGAKGEQGDAGISVVSIIKTNTVGLVDTYTITYSNTTTSTFDVTNGADGTDGIDGISFLWKGAYDNGTTYEPNDAVSHNGSSYICILESTGNLPTNTTYWSLMAQKGIDGTGSGDITGSGVENEIAYFTAEKTIDNLPVATYPSLTELSYVKGVTSGIQTQLGNKENVANKVTSFQATPDDSHYPSEKLTYDQLALKADLTTPTDSIYRQAIINGNFDVWQRGTSFTNPVALSYIADRFAVSINGDAGFTLPTSIIHSRQILTSGDIQKSFYHYRINVNGAGTGTVGNFQYLNYYRIENGTRFLCGDGKTVTLSFYARSSIANKKMIVSFSQRYGTGGSPSANETIKGNLINLTSNWTKYTVTVTTNTLSGKTFGTNNDDFLQFRFDYIWSSAYGATVTDDSVSDETFLGAGTIDIAQVQLNAGSVALPFQPKSFADELRDCQRYYEKSFSYATAPSQNIGTTVGSFLYMPFNSTGAVQIPFKVQKRTVPTITTYNPISANANWRDVTNNADRTVVVGDISETGVNLLATTFVNTTSNFINWTASAEL